MRRFLPILFILLMAACTENPEPAPTRLVVEGSIDSDGYPYVFLSQSVSVEHAEMPLKDVPVRWGKVTVSDGVNSVILTGRADKTQFPPYVYYSSDFKGMVGKTYTLEAEYHGMRVTARSQMLAPPIIYGVEFTRASDDSNLYSGKILFRAPEPGPCNFVVFVKVLGKDEQFYPGFMGIKQTSDMELTSVALFRGRFSHHRDEVPYEPNFEQGATVDFILARVDDGCYEFWEQYQDVVYFQNTLFISGVSSLKGNVDGGYGCFTARGAARMRVIVP